MDSLNIEQPCPPPPTIPWWKSKRVRSGVVTLVGGAATALSLIGNFNVWLKVTAVLVTATAAALNQFWGLTADRAITRHDERPKPPVPLTP